MMTLDSRYTIPSTVLLQRVDDEVLLFNSANGLFFTLNEMGAVFWQSMSESNTLQDIFNSIAQEYEVEADLLAQDIITFSQTLAEQGLLNFETQD
ncbi:MAG: PqqD family protein [Sulfuricurvum sp.]|nr:PqqD family protein [Sulfuricurvum sp.]